MEKKLLQQWTCWNRKENEDSVEERLDRFWATFGWSALFPNDKVWHLDEELLDHLPVALNLVEDYRSHRKARHRFENIWAFYDSCVGIIENA